MDPNSIEKSIREIVSQFYMGYTPTKSRRKFLAPLWEPKNFLEEEALKIEVAEREHVIIGPVTWSTESIYDALKMSNLCEEIYSE